MAPGPAPPTELQSFLCRIAQKPDEFIVFDNGFRTLFFTYTEVGHLAAAFAARLRALEINPGDTVIIWSESRPGWIVALWACLLEGIIAVPVESLSSADWFRRIEDKVHPRLVLLGDRVSRIVPSGDTPFWPISQLEEKPSVTEPLRPRGIPPESTAEIVFTSGATATPKGVVITHRNLFAQLRPLEAPFGAYQRYVRLFVPLRILNLLPMSHLFGQSMATFIPPLLPASVFFISGANPREIVRQIHSRRAAVLVAVPKVLEVLRDYVLHQFPEASEPVEGIPVYRRWWRFRRVHFLFGWKFCCFISGGAPLPPALERFWSNMAFVVVQGYGLTETAPVISFSHPFHVKRGTTGKPVRGVEVKIADDGEILVRGENVTPGYFEAPEETSGALRGGWLYTGDLGELDSGGNLVIRGRKKEMIVTGEGLKAWPEDIETVLNALPGVRESAAVAKHAAGHDQVHAVLILEPGVSADEVVKQANARLEEHQKIRSFSLWPGIELPRTKSTLKLRRAEIAAAVASETPAAPAAPVSGDLATLLAKYAQGRAIRPDTTLEELGLSSLDRVGLMMDLEARLDSPVNESAFSTLTRVADLDKPLPVRDQPSFPAWNRRWLARAIRAAALNAFLLPLADLYARRSVSGLENLRHLRGPVLFAGNHQSYFDTPIILASLPARLRRRVCPAMAKEFFTAHFHPAGHPASERATAALLYTLAALLFNGFPIPQTESTVRESIRYMGELADEGWSILIFPEGRHSQTDEIGRFLPGAAMIGSHLRLPVVPVRLRGSNQVLPRGARRAHRAPVSVAFGRALAAQDGESDTAFSRRIEDAVRAL